MIRRRNAPWPLVIAVVLLLTGTAAAEDPLQPRPSPGEDETIRRELDELRGKQRELERRLNASEARQKANEAKPRPPEALPKLNVPTPKPDDKTPKPDDTTPHFRFGHGGFVLGTADRKTEIRFRAVLHVDGRAYFGGTAPIPDTFLLRRVRPFIEGTLFGILEFRLMPDFGQGQSLIQDAYLELRPWQWLRLRAGKFRSPIGLEWLQSDSTLHLVERSLATDLVPWRDVGVMLAGDVGHETFCYAIAVFNGAPDSGNGPDFDPQSEKDYVARIFFHPLRPAGRSALAYLGLGVAASYGQVRGTATATNLPTYRSTGQQPIFAYINSAMAPDEAVLPARDRWRASPQFYWYVGPIGLLAEYVHSSQRVERLGVVATLENQAWNVTASFVMTLEHAGYDGVVPKRPVDFRHKNLGAFELAVRYSELRIDAGAFPNFADPSISVRRARELAGGLNWYLTEYARFMLSFNRTDFLGGAPMGGNREQENALMGRLQLSL